MAMPVCQCGSGSGSDIGISYGGGRGKRVIVPPRHEIQLKQHFLLFNCNLSISSFVNCFFVVLVIIVCFLINRVYPKYIVLGSCSNGLFNVCLYCEKR